MSDLKARLSDLVQKWRAKAAITDSFHATMGTGWHVCADDLAALLVGEEPHPRMFPIQDGPAIPWEVISRFGKQCERNHDQTVERLAQRGGLGVGEALPILMGEDYYKFWAARGGYDDKKKPEHINELLALVQQRQKQFAVGEEPAADHPQEQEEEDLARVDTPGSSVDSRTASANELAWRCFHCDEIFIDRALAQEHFGTCETRIPACRLSSDDVKQLRALEALNVKLNRELDSLENDARLWHESEADRIRRIGNVQWWQELDSREGERLALLEQIAQLKASLPAPPGAASPSQQLQEKEDDPSRVAPSATIPSTGSTAKISNGLSATNWQKSGAIGGGAKPDQIDDSHAVWRCGCHEDQHGYHLCPKHWEVLMAEAAASPSETLNVIPSNDPEYIRRWEGVRDMGEATDDGDRICEWCNQQVPRHHRCAVGEEPAADQLQNAAKNVVEEFARTWGGNSRTVRISTANLEALRLALPAPPGAASPRVHQEPQESEYRCTKCGASLTFDEWNHSGQCRTCPRVGAAPQETKETRE